MRHECSWEPEENLTHCAQLMREWFKLGLTAQKQRLAEARTIGINAVSMSERRLSDTEWLVVTDLSQAEYDYNTMLVQICLAAGIALSEVLFLWASPPCNSISPCGTVNDDSPFFQNGDFSSLDSRLEERWSVRALRRIDPQTRL